MKKVIRINQDDNVAVAIEPLEKGEVVNVGGKEIEVRGICN